MWQNIDKPKDAPHFKTEAERQARLDDLNRRYEGLSDDPADDARARRLERLIALASMATVG